MRYFLGNPKTTPFAGEDLVALSGWYASSDADWIKFACPDLLLGKSNVQRASSFGLKPPGLAGAYNNNRFSIELPIDQGCSITLYFYNLRSSTQADPHH